MDMSEESTVESRISPPALSCPKCEGLLPSALGDLQCTLCSAKVRIDHPVTRKKWQEEKVGCPECGTVLIVGVDKRPAHLKCASCTHHFTLTPNIPKVEITCPGCERQLRMKRKPGERRIDCPACSTAFNVKF
jgi:DNA-directed RNA polymerase subunit M/transcription elongation factor TFIIS